MKKTVLVLALAVFVTGGAFAHMFSAGGGTLFGGGRLGSVSGSGDFTSADIQMNAFNVGSFLFLDATFVELSIASVIGAIWDDYDFYGPSGRERGSDTGSLFSIDFTLLGKYPFAVASNFSIFPLFGVSYSVVLLTEMDGDTAENPFHFNTFRLLLGFGGDINFTSRIFLRASLLGYYRFASRGFRNYAKDIRDMAFDNGDYAFSADHSGGFGGELRLAVGFRF